MKLQSALSAILFATVAVLTRTEKYPDFEESAR